MDINGLVAGLLVTATFGLICTFIMMIYLNKGKVEIKSSYNYQPKWARVDLPEDVKTKINKEATKWLVFDSSALFCAMIIGCVYSIVSGNNNALTFILFACINMWVLIMFAIIVGVYVHARSLEKKYNTGKT